MSINDIVTRLTLQILNIPLVCSEPNVQTNTPCWVSCQENWRNPPFFLPSFVQPGKEKLLAKSKEATRSRIFQISHSHRKKKQESMLEEAAGASHQVAPQGTPQEDGVSDKKLVANQATDDGDVVMESVPATATTKKGE